MSNPLAEIEDYEAYVAEGDAHNFAEWQRLCASCPAFRQSEWARLEDERQYAAHCAQEEPF